MTDDLDSDVAFPQLPDMAQSIVAEALSVNNLEKLEIVLGNAISNALKLVTAGTIKAAAGPIAVLAEGVLGGVQLADPSIRRLSSIAVNTLFGTNTSEGDFAVDAGGRVTLSSDIAATIMDRFAASGTAPLGPSDAAAKKYLDAVINLDVEGWFLGVLVEAASSFIPIEGVGHLEQFGELKNTVVRSLGIGRITRSVLRPLIDATVIAPFKWQVNKTYTPELLPPALAVQQFFRGVITHDQLVEELARQGWSTDRVEAHVAQARKRESLDDYVWNYLHGFTTLDAVMSRAHDDGWEDFEINARIGTLQAKLLQPLLEETYREYESAYVDGHTDSAQLASAAAAAYEDPGVRAAVTNLADAKRAARKKRISKGDIETAVKRNIASILEYRQWLQEENYDDDAATMLELLLQSTIQSSKAAADAKAKSIADKAAAKTAAATAHAAALALKAATRVAEGPSLGTLEALVLAGVLSLDRYAAAAAAHGYSDADVHALTQGVQTKLDAHTAQVAARASLASTAAAKSLSLGDLEKSFESGAISQSEFSARLTDKGFSPGDVGLLVGLVQAKLTAAAAAVNVKAAAAAAAKDKGLSLAEAESAVTSGVWTMDQFNAWIQTAGIAADAATVLRATLQTKLDATAAANATHAAIANDLSGKAISLSTLETAVVHGDRPIADVSALLTQQRYSAVDIQTMLQLLQEKVDAYQAAQAKRAAAIDATKNKPLSYAQVERAVLTGVLTIADAGDYLKQQGYDDADALTLQQELADQLAAQSALPAVRKRAAAAAAGLGQNLTTFESDVVDGTRTAAQYDQLLRQVTVPDEDRAQLESALQLRVQQQQDALALEQAAAATLKARNLSLAEWQAGVKANLRSIDDYRAFLLQQDFSAADAGVLVQLLQTQMAAAAAKAAPPAPPASPATS